MASKPKICFGKISIPTASSSAGFETPIPVAEAVDSSSKTVPSSTPEETPGTSSGGFGSFSWKGEKPKTLSPEEEEMQRIMGFEGFKSSKKEQPTKKSAKRFDVEEMVKAIKGTGRIAEDLEEVLPLPEKKDDDTDKDSEEDVDGPAPPPNYQEENEKSSDSENEVRYQTETYNLSFCDIFSRTYAEMKYNFYH